MIIPVNFDTGWLESWFLEVAWLMPSNLTYEGSGISFEEKKVKKIVFGMDI